MVIRLSVVGALLIAAGSPSRQRMLSLRQHSRAMLVCFLLLGEVEEHEKNCGMLALIITDIDIDQISYILATTSLQWTLNYSWSIQIPPRSNAYLR